MTTLYLIRHGATDYNFQKRFQGVSDLPLNEMGFQQSKYLVPYFKEIPLDKIYISPLLRTLQTAQPLAESKGLTPEVVPGLQELDGGLLEGMKETDILTQYPVLYHQLKEEIAKFAAPQGESSRQAYDRIIQAIEWIIQKNPMQSVAVFSHGFVSHLFLTYAFKIPFSQIQPLMLENTSVTKLVSKNIQTIDVIYSNDFSHLPPSFLTKP